jgi:hypothetical protein
LLQTSSSTTSSSASQNVAPNASFIVQAAGPADVGFQEGSAQLNANAAVDGYAIFHFDPSQQEAVVPLETRQSSDYLLAFDNTNGISTGVAIENASTRSQTIGIVLRDDTGAMLAGAIPITLNANGHISFVLSTQYPSTANIRGTIEVVAAYGEHISVLGIRFTPPGTLTTIPAMANVATTGGALAHVAVNSGWQTTFVLVNAGTSPASATLKFFDDNGFPLALPLTFPQGTIATETTSTFTQTVSPNASLWVASIGGNPNATNYQGGSAQLTTTGNVSGFAIFRYNPNGQEAVVPLESRNAQLGHCDRCGSEQRVGAGDYGSDHSSRQLGRSNCQRVDANCSEWTHIFCARFPISAGCGDSRDDRIRRTQRDRDQRGWNSLASGSDVHDTAAAGKIDHDAHLPCADPTASDNAA